MLTLVENPLQSNQHDKPFLRIGTRGSALALKQAELVRRKLVEFHGINPGDIRIEVIRTTGDRFVDRPLAGIGGKGLFTKEIELALIEHRVDIGVHSSKDVATTLPDGLGMHAFLKREDARDAFVSLNYSSIESLPQGAVLGTSSLRRAAQMKRLRPDLQIVGFRGNVETRMQKLGNGLADATLLAFAALGRLGLSHLARQVIDPHMLMPAPAQGAIGLETRDDDTRARDLIAPLNHDRTATAILAERRYLRGLDGSCRTPIGVYTRIDHGEIKMSGQILSLDGQTAFEDEVTGNVSDSPQIGDDLARRLRKMAGEEFFRTFEAAT